jgi:hypothetical protein
MDGERVYIQLNAANIITIGLCVLLGYGLLVGSSILYAKMKGQG